jgi:hypothetical protein
MTELLVFDVGAIIMLTAMHVFRRGRHWSGMVSRRGNSPHRATMPKHRR